MAVGHICIQSIYRLFPGFLQFHLTFCLSFAIGEIVGNLKTTYVYSSLLWPKILSKLVTKSSYRHVHVASCISFLDLLFVPNLCQYSKIANENMSAGL